MNDSISPKTQKAINKIAAAGRPMEEHEAFGHIRNSRTRVGAISEAISSGLIKKDRSHYKNGSGSPRYTLT